MKQNILSILYILLCSVIAAAQENTATIYIIQKSFMPQIISPKISVNNMQIGKLPNKKYITCKVPVGNVSVSLFESTTGKSDEISFRVNGNQTYYVMANIIDKSQASVMGKNHGQLGNITNGFHDVSINLARIPTQVGEDIVNSKKIKEALYADLSDFNLFEDESETYAQTSPAQESTPAKGQKPLMSSDVDINIPETKVQNSNTFALIIANEKYAFVDNVEYAIADGKAFREYCIKTLGIPERQVWLLENASLGIIANGVNTMAQAVNIFNNAKAIIYYCGHGIPDEKTSDAYIVPVDGKGTDVSSCYSLNQLYTKLSSTKASNITYFMDACFTGANREGSMLVAARGVAREAKKEILKGNTIVFSAASGDETAMPYREKGHGLFTYFLLKKLQETKGNVKLGELSEYINENVQREAFLSNEKPQNPVVATSDELTKSWKELKL